VRPEDIRLDPEAPAKARVHDVENHGVEKIVTLNAGDTLLRLTAPAAQKLAIDDIVSFSWNPRKIILFDKNSGNNISSAA
jgi:multiple sugar transport system ATP-binding protein